MRSTSRCLQIFIYLIFPLLSACVSDNNGKPPQEGLRERLLPDDRPIGQPLSSDRADVRIIRVDSRAEADSVFYGLCTGLPVTRMTYNGEIWMVCSMQPHYDGVLYYTYRPLSGWRVVGTIYVHSPELNRWGVKEIRFVETIKTRR